MHVVDSKDSFFAELLLVFGFWKVGSSSLLLHSSDASMLTLGRVCMCIHFIIILVISWIYLARVMIAVSVGVGRVSREKGYDIGYINSGCSIAYSTDDASYHNRT